MTQEVAALADDGDMISSERLRSQLPWWLGRPTHDLRFIVYARAFALASALRLLLPDAVQGSWLAPTAVSWLGVAALAINGSLLGWALCFVGGLLPILFLEDQLSQSGYLIACALVVLVCAAGAREGLATRLRHALPRGVRVLTMALYGLAALHKLNADYFDPAVSCANGGLLLLFEGLFTGGLPPWLAHAIQWSGWPWMHAAFELGLVVLLWRRPALGVMAAATMHLPLTIIFAPSFVFTASSGWVCFLREHELRALGRTLKRRALPIVLAGASAATLSAVAFFPGRWQTDPDWRIKEVVMWLGFAWLLETVTTRWRREPWGVPFRAGPEEADGHAWRGMAVATLFVVNGLTPYLGLQVHHTGAMLSNLRIDAGCYNSLLFPEWLRGDDPYVRIDEVSFAPGRAPDGYAASVQERLWGPDALWLARERWCLAHREPLPIRGSYRGEPFEISDFCAPDGWRFSKPWFPGLRRFQVNLLRRCPQKCVH